MQKVRNTSNQSGKVSRKDNLAAYIDRIKHLPPAPSHMVKLLAIFKEQDPDIDEVVKLVSRDPSLTTEVIKLCNSARFKGETRVADMFEAVSRLGFYEIYRVVMMISATRTISLENIETVLEVEKLCRHSMSTAVAAGVIAKTVWESADNAYITGLLHDIGKIALASAEGASYERLSRKFQTGGASLCEAEKKNFGFDHSEVGSELLARWGLPPEVVQAVKYHHHLEDAGDWARPAAIVALADLLANHAQMKSVTGFTGIKDFARAVAVLKLGPEETASVIAEVQEGFKREAGLMKAVRQ